MKSGLSAVNANGRVFHRKRDKYLADLGRPAGHAHSPLASRRQRLHQLEKPKPQCDAEVPKARAATGLQTEALYDGLGRTTESRTYEGGTNYIAAQTQYDALGRAYKTSN